VLIDPLPVPDNWQEEVKKKPYQVGGRGGAGRGDETVEHDQPADRILRMSEPADFQVHAAFEENDRHREPDENGQCRAQNIGADHAQAVGAKNTPTASSRTMPETRR
jgi:hypothetical protein